MPCRAHPIIEDRRVSDLIDRLRLATLGLIAFFARVYSMPINKRSEIATGMTTFVLCAVSLEIVCHVTNPKTTASMNQNITLRASLPRRSTYSLIVMKCNPTLNAMVGAPSKAHPPYHQSKQSFEQVADAYTFDAGLLRSRKGLGLEERHGINDTTTIRRGIFELTSPRKPIFTTVLDIRCKLLLYIDKVGRLGLEPRTKALKGPCSTN